MGEPGIWDAQDVADGGRTWWQTFVNPREAAQAKLDEAKQSAKAAASDVVDQAKEQAQEVLAEKLQDCKGIAEEKIQEGKELVGQFTTVGLGAVLGLQAGVRLMFTLAALRDGTPMYLQTDWVVNAVDTMLSDPLVIAQTEPQLVQLLDEIKRAAEDLREDIRKHCDVTLGLKACGQATGLAGGCLIVAGALAQKPGLVKAGKICAGAEAGARQG